MDGNHNCCCHRSCHYWLDRLVHLQVIVSCLFTFWPTAVCLQFVFYRFMKKKKPKGAEDGKDGQDDEQGLVDGEQVEAEEVIKDFSNFPNSMEK